jgi:excisionase family DNA binding protein
MDEVLVVEIMFSLRSQAEETMTRKAKEMSVREAAVELEMEINNVYSLVRAKRIRARKVGGLWRLDPEDVGRRARARQERKERASSASGLRERPSR